MKASVFDIWRCNRSIYSEIVMSSTYSNIEEIAKEENENLWDSTRNRLDGWKHHINRINHRKHKISDDTLAEIIERMKNHSIKMFVEAKSMYTGTESTFEEAGLWDVKRDISYLNRIYDYGYEHHGLELDGVFFDYTNAGMVDVSWYHFLVLYVSLWFSIYRVDMVSMKNSILQLKYVSILKKVWNEGP